MSNPTGGHTKPSISSIVVTNPNQKPIAGKLLLENNVKILWVNDPEQKVPLDTGNGRRGHFVGGVTFPWSHDKRVRGIVRDFGHLLAKSIQEHLSPKPPHGEAPPPVLENRRTDMTDQITDQPAQSILSEMQLDALPTEPREKLAVLITELRKLAGYSWGDVAAAVEVKYDLARCWEVGKPRPSVPNAVDFIKLSELYDGYELLIQTHAEAQAAVLSVPRRGRPLGVKGKKGLWNVMDQNAPAPTPVPTAAETISSTMEQHKATLDVADVKWNSVYITVMVGTDLVEYDAVYLSDTNKWMCFDKSGPFEVEQFEVFRRK